MWTLVSSNTAEGSVLTAYDLPDEGTVHIALGVNNTHPCVVRTIATPMIMRELGRIDCGPFGVKLKATSASLLVLPNQPHGNGPTAKFRLQPQSGEGSESIFLRHGDQIRVPNSASHLTCQWTDSEVQVNSSAAADGVAGTPEDETEDEGENVSKIDAPVPAKKSQPRATPQLSHERSATIVQETPTAARVENVSDMNEATVHEAEAFSTARTGKSQDQAQSPPKATTSSPRVQIPSRSTRKRTLPPADEADASKSDNEALAGPTKRAKTTDSDTEDSRLSNVERSTSATMEDYDGPTPRVACSNSTITKTSQTVKFLKKQGGLYVEILADRFNILCVRDGGLQKTTKVLYAIASGIPIVTDQWLRDSASAKRLLSVSSFKPSIPEQEEEWKIKLGDILEKPQAPFTDYNLHFTKSLKSKYASFPEIEAVCKAAGAKSVTTTTKAKMTENTIVLAENGDDTEAQRLIKDGATCYTKDFFTFSILRGVVDLESDEFKIKETVTDTPSKEQKKKRGRKSA